MSEFDPPAALDYATRVEADYQADKDFERGLDTEIRHEPAPDLTPPLARVRLNRSISALFSLALQSEMAGRQEHADQLCGEAEALKKVLAAWERQQGGFEE